MLLFAGGVRLGDEEAVQFLHQRFVTESVFDQRNLFNLLFVDELCLVELGNSEGYLEQRFSLPAADLRKYAHLL